MKLSGWLEIEKKWPPLASPRPKNYAEIRQSAYEFLLQQKIRIGSFSHYGVVVKNIESSVKILNARYSGSLEDIKKSWVTAYSVYVARYMVDNIELEFIQPSGNSFFQDFFDTHDEGLQHLGFFTKNIDKDLMKLKDNGLELLDKQPRSGTHGKIIFFKPTLFSSILIELCQKNA